jgi:hypothetical protein
MPTAVTFSTYPRRVTHVLLWLAALTTLASVAAQVSKHLLGYQNARGLVPLFDATAEGNIPTWLASCMLLLCAVLTAVIAVGLRRGRVSGAWRWTGLAAIFAYGSVDEAAQIHELTVDPLHDALHTGGVLRYGWVIPGGLIVVLLAFQYRRLVADVPKRIRRLLLAAALVYVGAVLGLDMIEGAVYDASGRLGGATDAVASTQELGEMVGLVLFVHALLSYLVELGVTVRLAFVEQPEPPPARWIDPSLTQLHSSTRPAERSGAYLPKSERTYNS